MKCVWFALCLRLFLLTPAIAETGRWQGKVERREGARYITNPAEGFLPTLTITPKELWRVGDNDEGIIFGFIGHLGCHKNRVYVVDTVLPSVMVFDSDGKYLFPIGRTGEGPGEYLHPNSVFFLDSLIAVTQSPPTRIDTYNEDGVYQDVVNLPDELDRGLKMVFKVAPAGRYFIIHGRTYKFRRGFQEQWHYLVSTLQDTIGSFLYQEDRLYDHATWYSTEEEKEFFTAKRWAVGPNGNVYITPHRDQYLIEVWDPGGKLVRVITREYKHRRRTNEDLNLVRGLYLMPGARGQDLRLSNYDESIYRFYVLADNTLLVLSSRGCFDRPDDSIGIFDVFDPDGRFVRQLVIRGKIDPVRDRLYFEDGRLLAVTKVLSTMMSVVGESDDDLTPMTLICYDYPRSTDKDAIILM